MTALAIILGLLTVFSLYDYFSVRKWDLATSKIRNEVVFEKRNQKYGAYAMRKAYDKNLILIIFGTIGFFGITFTTLAAFRGAPQMVKKQIIDTTVIISCGGGYPPIRPEIILGDRSTHIQRPLAFTEPIVSDIEVLYADYFDPLSEIAEKDEVKKMEESMVDVPDQAIFIDSFICTLPPWENDAVFDGGMDKLIRFLKDNLVYPETALENGMEGKCWVRFKVSKIGEISEIRMMREVENCPECSEECIRVIEKMPKWNPGTTHGKNVDSFYNLPIHFELE